MHLSTISLSPSHTAGRSLSHVLPSVSCVPHHSLPIHPATLIPTECRLAPLHATRWATADLHPLCGIREGQRYPPRTVSERVPFLANPSHLIPCAAVSSSATQMLARSKSLALRLPILPLTSSSPSSSSSRLLHSSVRVLASPSPSTSTSTLSTSSPSSPPSSPSSSPSHSVADDEDANGWLFGEKPGYTGDELPGGGSRETCTILHGGWASLRWCSGRASISKKRRTRRSGRRNTYSTKKSSAYQTKQTHSMHSDRHTQRGDMQGEEDETKRLPVERQRRREGAGVGLRQRLRLAVFIITATVWSGH